VEDCDPVLYGYRGLAVQWDFISGGYTVEDGHGLNAFSEDMIHNLEDFHRMYCPYRRLVGADVMQQHLNNIRYLVLYLLTYLLTYSLIHLLSHAANVLYTY